LFIVYLAVPNEQYLLGFVLERSPTKMQATLAALMASTAPFEPQPSTPKPATSSRKSVPRYRPHSCAAHSALSRRVQHSASDSDDSGDDDSGAPDSFVPDPQVCREFGITAMTLWRWTNDAALCFPPPIEIRKRNFRSRSALEEFKTRMIARGTAACNERSTKRETGPRSSARR
jgi:hypothetical protein